VPVVLNIQHAMRMLRIILPSVACSAVPCLSTLCHKRNDVWKKLFNIKCVLIFSTILSEIFLIPQTKTTRDTVISALTP